MSMRYLDKKIFAYTIVCFFTVCEIIRQTVMMKKISGNACSLCLPVQPDSSSTVVDMVSADDHIDSCVHFDTADLCAGQVLLVVDMVDVIIFNNGKNTSQMSDNTGLTAVMDVTSSDDVGADMFFVPSFIGSLADAVTFCLSSIFIFPFQPFVVVIRLEIFSKRNSAAFGFIDLAVFNDPSFGPVRADHSFLISSRRSPLSSSLADTETGECDISDPFTFWVEAVSSYTDLNVFFIWIFFMEVCINNSLGRWRSGAGRHCPAGAEGGIPSGWS